MGQYTKKPVTIEAVQWIPGSTDEEVQALDRDNIRLQWKGLPVENYRLTIKTPEGELSASPEDYIIKGVAGEVYLCKPDIFTQTYRPGGIDSTSDDRVQNNVMRHEYKVLSENEKIDMQAIKDAGLDFYRHIETIESHSSTSRELSLAKTKIEEAVMWAVKHITG